MAPVGPWLGQPIGVGGLIKSETDKKRKNYRSNPGSPAPTSIINAPTLIPYTCECSEGWKGGGLARQVFRLNLVAWFAASINFGVNVPKPQPVRGRCQ